MVFVTPLLGSSTRWCWHVHLLCWCSTSRICCCESWLASFQF